MKTAEGVSKSDDVETSARKCTFTLQIDAAVESGVFEAPGFRFRFLDGSRKQTSAIGSGHGWTPVHDIDSPEVSSPSPVHFRFEQSFPDVAVTESLAASLDDDPILSFFLFDHPGLAGAGATPRAQGKETKPSTAKTAAVTAPVPTPAVEFTPKAFAGLYEMDVSSLLSGSLDVKQVWAAKAADSSSQSLCLIPSASGLSYLSIQLTVDKPVLSGELLKKLNPLTITIGTGRQLPGAVSQGIGTASPHSPLQKYCKPAFALIHFFPDQLQAKSTSAHLQSVPRLLLTPGQRQSGTVRWNASVTILCGRIDPLKLVDAIRFAALTVEIRDRDLKQEGTLARYQLKWESLYTTGVDPGVQQDPDISSVDSTHPVAPVKPMELSAVDDIARSDWRLMLVNSNRLFPYGLATFRLTELLNTAKQSMGGMKSDTDRPYMALKLTNDIVAMKRRASPLGTATLSEESELPATIDLSPLEKVIREPGAYVSTGASLSIYAVLQSPVEILDAKPLEVLSTAVGSENSAAVEPFDLKFSRMVVIIPYKDNATLGEVAKAMTTVNLKALPGVPIRSYQLTEVEKKDCESGALDVITGTQIIDNQFRMIILEGLTHKGMKFLHEQLQRKCPNDPQGYRMFCNDELRFTRRLYTEFEIDLKRIKLRYPLPVLMTTPDIYMRAKVSENCHQALARLADMRKVQRLIEVKHLDLFPTSQMLLEVESKYGESITLEDIHGSSNKSSKSSQIDVNHSGVSAPTKLEEGEQTPSRHRAVRLKASTDSTNASYELSRRSRVERDFILERKKHADLLQTEYLEKKQVAEMFEDKSQGLVYLYSGQRLRNQDIQQDKMRDRLSKDRHATYTYSRDFQSLALSMINPDALLQIEEQENRKKWTSQRRFIYPAPRQPSEYLKHPNAPSEARREELRQPFVDNINQPKPVSRDSSEFCRKGPEFSTLPSKDTIFGGTNGDGTVNPDYFRSVHLCGEGLRLEMEDALKKEQEDWERRLVVDKKQLKFIAHGNICSQAREKPSQLDKISDILKSSARSKPIRIVKNATLPSGKRVPLEKAPVTIHNQEEYVGCVAATFASTLRPSDRNQFVAVNEMSGKPKDFFFPSATKILTPPVKQFVTRKEVVPVRETEKRGLVWRNE